MLILLMIIPILLIVPFRLTLIFDNSKGYFRICIVWRLLFFNIEIYDRRLLIGKKKKAKKQDRNLLYLFHALHVKRFSLQAQIGTGDAAQTALLAGTLHVAAAAFLPPLSQRFASFDTNPELHINPDFSDKSFSVAIKCITVFTLGNIIIVYLKHYFGSKKKAAKFAKESRV